MSLQGPVVVVGDEVDPVLLAALEAAGASPAMAAPWSRAAGVVTRSQPAGIIVPHATAASAKVLDKIATVIAGAAGYMPVLAVPEAELGHRVASALPIAPDAPLDVVLARLAAAQRVRTLQATVARRRDLIAATTPDLADWSAMGDPLDDATVLVTGRGRSYPALGTAVGERLGLIGALSVETAARYLNVRDVDGLVIGEGFGPPTLEAFLTALAEDPRFRDLPIALLAPLPRSIDPVKLPNLECLSGEPKAVVAAILPLVRLHAFEARLKRELASLDAQGLIDPATGLFTVTAFLRDLGRALGDAQRNGVPMSIARFAFPRPLDQRASLDAARLVARLVRNVDFACRASDGSVLVVFTAAGLEKSHVVARRIGSVLRQTMLAPADDPNERIDPAITLAVLKSADTVESLLGRISEPTPVAAA